MKTKLQINLSWVLIFFTALAWSCTTTRQIPLNNDHLKLVNRELLSAGNEIHLNIQEGEGLAIIQNLDF